jgi:hypothetical protein
MPSGHFLSWAFGSLLTTIVQRSGGSVTDCATAPFSGVVSVWPVTAVAQWRPVRPRAHGSGGARLCLLLCYQGARQDGARRAQSQMFRGGEARPTSALTARWRQFATRVS